jgi:hypothetical protein
MFCRYFGFLARTRACCAKTPEAQAARGCRAIPTDGRLTRVLLDLRTAENGDGLLARVRARTGHDIPESVRSAGTGSPVTDAPAIAGLLSLPARVRAFYRREMGRVTYRASWSSRTHGRGLKKLRKAPHGEPRQSWPVPDWMRLCSGELSLDLQERTRAACK